MDAAKPDLEYILQNAYTGGRPLPVNKYHDYFTSALPSPQKAGEPVTIPMSNNANVLLYSDQNLTKPIWYNGTSMAPGWSRMYGAVEEEFVKSPILERYRLNHRRRRNRQTHYNGIPRSRPQQRIGDHDQPAATGISGAKVL